MFNKKLLLAIFLVFSSLIILTSCDEDDPSSPSEEHFDAAGVEIEDATGAVFFKVFKGQVDASVNEKFEIPIGMSDHFEIYFLDDNGNRLEEPEDHHYTLGYEIEDPSIVALHQHEDDHDDDHYEEWEFHLEGLKAGETTLELSILHEGHSDFRTGKFPVLVVE